MNTLQFYLVQVLPYVFGFAAISFLLGTTLGWMCWGGYPDRAFEVEGQNESLRQEIHRLQRSN